MTRLIRFQLLRWRNSVALNIKSNPSWVTKSNPTLNKSNATLEVGLLRYFPKSNATLEVGLLSNFDKELQYRSSLSFFLRSISWRRKF